LPWAIFWTPGGSGCRLAAILGLRRRDVELVRERIPRQLADELRMELLHLRERLCLRHEHELHHLRVRLEDPRDRVLLRLRRRAALLAARLEVDLHDQLLLDVIRVRARQREDRDEEADDEHPDEHRHRRGERGRDVGGEATPCLGDEEAQSHSPV
jgi:hypothetical protein